MKAEMNRRKFLGGAAAAAAAFTIVPSHVLGGAGNVAPSEKITFAYIGCGTQGLREMVGLLPMPEVQIVAVCDPEKDGDDYVDWSRDGLRRRDRPGVGQARLAEGRADSGRAGCRQGDRRDLLCQGAGLGQVQGLHHVCSISASCWRRRRTSTRSRS